MAKALVTGGAGFIGSHIADMLVSLGHQVTIVDDLSSGVRENVNPKATLKVLDICSVEARTEIGKLEPEILIHAAAQMSVRVSMEDPAKDTRINLLGLTNILQSFQGRKLPYFMFLCTGGALYGEQKTYPAPENDPIRPSSCYGLAKYVSELYLDLWQREFGLKYASLRLGNVYGPRQNPHGEAGVVAIFCKTLLSGKTPTINGTGEQTRDYVYVEDVVNAFRLALAERVEGSYNIGTARETSVTDLYGMIAKSLGSNVKATHGPAKVGEQLRSVIDFQSAQKSFDWQPQVPIEEGVKRTAEWFKAAR